MDKLAGVIADKILDWRALSNSSDRAKRVELDMVLRAKHMMSSSVEGSGLEMDLHKIPIVESVGVPKVAEGSIA